MKKIIRKFLIDTKALDVDDDKLRLLHPVGFLFFMITIPIVFICCALSDEVFQDYLLDNHKFF